MNKSQSNDRKAKQGSDPADVVVPNSKPVGAATPQHNNRQGEEQSTQDWIAEVSHELRLPIANIKLLLETLLNGALDDPATARRMLSRAQIEADRLQSLVVNLLSVETVSQSREINAQWVSLAPRVNAAVETVVKLATEKGLNIEIAVESGAKIYVNPPQLDQVILNLLENAIKFTPAGGTVRISSGATDGCFVVTDTGIGMPQHEIPKIFQRFYRIDRAQSRGSTGLGLSIVKHIVDLHGAKISVSSKEGSGSSFSVEFPGPRVAGRHSQKQTTSESNDKLSDRRNQNNQSR